MSTRSNIAIEDPKTKKVKVIYVHSDGYPYGVGKCLVDNYNRYDYCDNYKTGGDNYPYIQFLHKSLSHETFNN